MEAGSDKRKDLVINPRYQHRFLMFLVGLAILIATIFYATSHYFAYRFEQVAIQAQIPDGNELYRFIAREKIIMKAVFALLSIVVWVGLMIGGVILSHRVVGPLYRLQTHMDKIAKGKAMGPVQFRPKDYFQELAESFNRMVERLKKD